MKLRIEIDLENAAFEDDPGAEVQAILVTQLLLLDYAPGERRKLRDSNGNTVGVAEVVED